MLAYSFQKKKLSREIITFPIVTLEKLPSLDKRSFEIVGQGQLYFQDGKIVCK